MTYHSDLRKAAEMALERLESHEYWMDEEAIKALRKALAQPEEKMRIEGSGKLTTKPYPDSYESEQEFRGALTQWDGFVYSGDKSYRLSQSTGSFGIGDTPPKREWVGLTKEDMPVGDNPMFDTDEFAFGAAWAQAKLKEKNT